MRTLAQRERQNQERALLARANRDRSDEADPNIQYLPGSQMNLSGDKEENKLVNRGFYTF